MGSIEEVFVSSRDEVSYPPTKPLKAKPSERNKEKFCLYHNTHGHTTSTCYDLKDEIENLIRQGHLRKYRKDSEGGPDAQTHRIEGEIHVIAGGPSLGGESRRSQKEYEREVRRKIPGTVCRVDRAPKSDPVGPASIEFSEEDADGVVFPHYDPLVITAMIGNHVVHRCLVDGGSSADVLYESAFRQMGIPAGRLRPSKKPLTGFTGNTVVPDGLIELPITVGEDPCKATAHATFVVVRGDSSYNAIIGRPTLVSWKAVVSAYCLCMKFPTARGIGVVRGNQGDAQRCYNTSIREPQLDRKDKGSDGRDRTRAEPRTTSAGPSSLELDPRLPNQ